MTLNNQIAYFRPDGRPTDEGLKVFRNLESSGYVSDAPSDGTTYGRRNGAWVDVNAGVIASYAGKTGAYTVLTTDYVINCTSGTFTVTLPTAVGIAGQQFVIKNSGNGTITVDGNGAQTIDGQLTQSLSQFDSMSVCSDGGNWIII